MAGDVVTVDHDVTAIVPPAALSVEAPDGGAGVQVRADRAALAMLHLQLRAAEHDAEQAEAAPAVDLSATRTKLVADLARLVEERRSVLDAELAAERHRTEQVIAAAKAEAMAIITRARPVTRSPEPEPEPEPTVVAPAVIAAAPIDTAALSQAVAVAVASALADRFPQRLAEPVEPALAPASARRSAASSMAKLDVILPLVAAVIVLVILVAWVGGP